MALTRHTLIDGRPVTCAYEGGFDHSCELLVIGLGTAGAVAAIAAAKRGCDVIGVDIAPLPGGVGTAGCVWDYYFGANGGIYTEINRTADAISEQGSYIPSTVPGYKLSYPTPVKALALERELAKYGARCFYGSIVTDVFTDGERICGAAFFDGEHCFTVGASSVIDGAEGAVCRLLGLRDLGGRGSDNKTARFSRTVGVMDNDMVRGLWCFCGQYSGSMPEEAARITYKWGAQPPMLCDSYDEKNRLYALGWEIGKREVFCYETDEVYRFSDYLDGKRPSNVIFYSFSPLDNSNPDLWNEDEDFQDWQVLCDMHAYGVSIGITPGMLIAKGVDGLLLAGKHIGTGHTMTSTVRMRTDIEKCGEAAGVMAALALKHGCSERELADRHFGELRSILAESGCYAPANDRGIGDLNLPDNGMWRTCPLPGTIDELRALLSSIHPALGLVAVRTGAIADEALSDRLVGWLGSEDKLLRENSAAALGLLGDRRCLPTLRAILAGEPETHVYRSPNRYFFPWLYQTELCCFVKAACLVARFGEEADRHLLESLAAYDGEDHKRQKAAEYARAFLKKQTRA